MDCIYQDQDTVLAALHILPTALGFVIGVEGVLEGLEGVEGVLLGLIITETKMEEQSVYRISN